MSSSIRCIKKFGQKCSSFDSSIYMCKNMRLGNLRTYHELQ